MRSTTLLLAAPAAALALAACGHHADTHIGLHSGALSVHDGQAVIKGADGSTARISATGQLTIDGREVAVSDAQRTQLVAYHDAATGLTAHAVATGVAGVAVGVTVAKAVAAGLASGDMSGVNGKVESQAGEVKREALKICDDLAAVRAAQEALVAELAAFRPYAVVAEHDVADCGRDLHPAPAK